MRILPVNILFFNRIKLFSGNHIAWLTLILFILLSAICVLIIPGRYLNIAFPLAALGVGALLYFISPILYLSFTWWLWFLTPLVRRLVDFRVGFNEPSPILLAPFFVTLLTLITFYKFIPKYLFQGGLPFLLSIASVIYGLLVGLLFNPLLVTSIRFLDWLVPILFGFHLFVNWRHYPALRNNTVLVFTWGIIVMGAYGLFQFVTAPDWDTFWLKHSAFNSGGIPVPFGLEIWSTAASNRPFAIFLMTGLLLFLLNQQRSAPGMVASVLGYICFLLSQRRSLWIGWVIGILFLVLSLQKKDKIRLLIYIFLLLIFILPFAFWQLPSGNIIERLTSFLNLSDDLSANIRVEYTDLYLDIALTSLVGHGFGSVGIDNGLVTILLHLGWFGTIPYFAGFFRLVANTFNSFTVHIDSFAIATRSIALVIFLQFPLASPQLEAEGMIMWGFISLSLASQQYHKSCLNLSDQHML